MRVSKKWLKKYVDFRIGDDLLAERLTMAGLEVESVTSQAANLKGIIVGEVRSVGIHPNADRLSLCSVFDGSGEVQVVCGAPNVESGQKVAFAAVGTTVPRSQHDPDGVPMQIGRVKIRGVESSGMICSGFELGLSDDREGILVLDSSARPGTPLSRHLHLDDTAFDIGVTANRPDLLSHIGVAREISALTRSPLKIPPVHLRTTRRGSLPLKVQVQDGRNCRRYSARVVRDITVGPSPGWLQALLTAAGVRPINNVVDVTNYVLMEIGQPLHAFDYDKLSGHQIIVRGGDDTSRFVTLDGKERIVDSSTLLICDGEGPVALAGVMGGENSEISGSTKTVVLESAYFDPVSIRRTAKRLGLSTEASQRFERGTDPNITLWALNRAADLLSQNAGGTVQDTLVDVYPRVIRELRIDFNAENSNKLLGIKLSNQTISGLLKRIGIECVGRPTRQGKIRFRVPTWRPDISREVDLIEEVARLYGYDKIEADTKIHLTLDVSPSRRSIEDDLGDYLSSAGYQEIITNSMLSARESANSTGESVRILNPISREMETLRSDLLHSMLTVIQHNINNGISSSRFYEFGKTYRMDPNGDPEKLGSFHEEEKLLIAIFGLQEPVFWGNRTEQSTIFTLKGECNALIRKISLDNPRYIPYSTPTALSERSIFIEISGERVGMIGTVSGDLLKIFDLESDIHFLELSMTRLTNFPKEKIQFREYPRYPVVTRDLAVVVDESVSIGDLGESIRQAAGEMLGEMAVFDIYRGNQLEPGKKSVAFSLEFIPREKTLGQEEIQAIMSRIMQRVSTTFNAVLRQ